MEVISRERAGYLATYIQSLHAATDEAWQSVLEASMLNLHPAARRRRRELFQRQVEAFDLMWAAAP
jgi:hypothetical protein